MQSIQYMGSKLKLLGFLEKEFSKLQINTFMDAFSGSVRVANHFKETYNVIANDKQEVSKVIAEAYLLNIKPKEFYQTYIDDLNNLEGIYGWFSENYGGTAQQENYNKLNIESSVSLKDGNPKIWQLKNSMKIDAIRNRIDEYFELTNVEKSVLLLSLILATNKISNVLGHQNGYLKTWATNTYNNIKLEVPDVEISSKKHSVYNEDIFNLLPQITTPIDMIYYDPPYGTRNENLSVSTRYSSFYHLWNTLILNNKPIIFGKAGKPISTKGWTPPLEKNKKDIISPLFKELLEKSNSKYISLSYSNQGLVTKEEFFDDIFVEGKTCKKVHLVEQEHKINSQTKTAKKDGTYISYDNQEEPLKEYLFIVEK
jgi:adenine-specific DNA-methyltransferase